MVSCHTCDRGPLRVDPFVFKRAETAGKPEMESMFEDVFMNQPAQLRAQQAELMSLEGPEACDLGEFPL